MLPVRNSRVTCPYWAPGSWSGGHHRGIDFAAAVGTPVLAPWGGTVVEVGHTSWGSAFGLAVVIDFDRLPDGSPGYWGILAHNSRILVHRGQRVEAGQRIADSGDTGHVTGPHCHFEVQIEARWRPASAGNVTRNPQPWLDAQPGGTMSGSNDDYLSLKATGVHTVRTNTVCKIDIDGLTQWAAENPTGRHLLGLYINLDLPASGTPERDACHWGGVRTWFQQVDTGEVDDRDETGYNGPVPCARYGEQHQLASRVWAHTVDRSGWEFCFQLYAFWGPGSGHPEGSPADFAFELETREVKIIGDKT